jgi:hypothetical protein
MYVSDLMKKMLYQRPGENETAKQIRVACLMEPSTAILCKAYGTIMYGGSARRHKENLLG